MFGSFSKKGLLGLFALLSLNTMNSSLMACECECYEDSYDCNRMYIGAFGGALYSNSTKMTQMGTAFFTEAEGGPLAVNARGRTKSTSTGFGGVQLGYEWSKDPCFGWTIAPAVELEGFWYGHSKTGHLFNTTDVDRLPEHDFLNSFDLDVGVYLVNVVFSLNNSCFGSFSPYVGGGFGAAHICLKNANSLQVAPLEAGINHFNSQRSDSSWAFAAQAKAGLRYNFCGSFHIFGEYRYVYLDCSNYILGSTNYATHVPTSPWNVKVHNIQYNAFAFGFQYDL